tara:strand:+ start:337 stop:648 length:312 start_codon:yes stop_codon:yes gene_type:complete
LELPDHDVVPQTPQNISFLISSFCIDHSPHEGHGGNPFSDGFTLGPLLTFRFLGMNHPLFGFFTLGMRVSNPNWNGMFKELTQKQTHASAKMVSARSKSVMLI